MYNDLKKIKKWGGIKGLRKQTTALRTVQIGHLPLFPSTDPSARGGEIAVPKLA